MILFVSLAAALTAAALAFVLPPLLRRRGAAPDARIAANAEVYREQLEEIGAELQRGSMTKEEYQRATREIERRIVAEHEGGAPEPARHRPRTAAALVLAVLIPLVAGFGYWQLGDLRALKGGFSAALDAKEMPALIEKLAARLQAAPGDAEGWALLGRALASLGHYERAAQALARALQLAPEDREVLVEFIKTLALAGRAEFEQRNYAAAIGYWERILPFAPPESEFARTVTESIAEAKAQAGGTAGGSTGGGGAAALRGLVRLDPALRAKVAPGDTVFVLARPVGGSRMPLAVTRTTADKLPYAFTLDDSMAMAPNAKLSGQSSVVVLARISKSGNPVPQKGDIEGVSAPVAPGAANVQVVLRKIVD